MSAESCVVTSVGESSYGAYDGLGAGGGAAEAGAYSSGTYSRDGMSGEDFKVAAVAGAVEYWGYVADEVAVYGAMS